MLGLVLRPSFSIVHAETTDYNNYYFSSVKLDVVVNEDNSYDITKTMQVQFGPFERGEHKGIVLRIPKQLTYIFDDNGKDRKQKYFCKITNVWANELYASYSEDGYHYIELGTDEYVNNTASESARLVTYTVKYRIEVGHDFAKGYDLLAFNLMGDDEPVSTKNFMFELHLPKSVNGAVPEFFFGESGSTETPEIDYLFDEETLTIKSNSAMSFMPYEALTIRMKLDDGYFSKATKFHSGVEIGVIAISIVLSVVIIIIALNKANKNRPVRVVEFYPPEGYTPCDCDYVINNSFAPKRLVSLILYWASKGIIKINNDENQKPKSITKIKELDVGAKIYEKTLFKEFFKNGDTYLLDTIDLSLGETMNHCAEDVKNLIGSRYKSSSRLSHFAMAMISLIPFIAIMVCLFVRTKCYGYIMFCLVLTVVLSFVAMLLWGNTYFVEDSDRKLNLPRVVAIMCVIFAMFFLAIVPKGYDLMMARFVAMIPVAIYVVMGKNIFSMTSEMKSIYGRLWGFKHSITIMEKDRIEKLVKEDPSYFYDILPYAYALNVLDDFVKNFEKIYMPTANSYVSPLNAYFMCTALNRSFASVPYKSTGSRFGTGGNGGFGGGFSGGGFGGGGSRGR